MHTIEEALQFIHSCNRFGGKKDSLARMRCLMKCLGDPQTRFPAVHIAGTNGKGSTAAITANILKKAGYRTGLFTSPFLVRFNERIRIDGAQIPDEDLVTLTAKVRTACVQVMEIGFAHPLEFEVVTALGFCYFAMQKVDIAVIEVGIGGLLDSTNVLETPLLSIITSISYDHTAILGDTLQEITAQKAGIIKNGRPVVCAPQPYPEVIDLLRKAAEEKEAPFYTASCAPGTCTAQGFLFLDRYLLPLPGLHQQENLGTVLCAAEILTSQGFSIAQSALLDGITGTHWSGRCQWIGNSLIDGAHNPDACRLLADYLDTYIPDRKKVLLFTAMKDKNTAACVASLAPRSDCVITTHIMPPRGESAQTLAGLFRHLDKTDVLQIEDPTAAFDEACRIAQETDAVVIVCGSLYLAGHVLSLLENRGIEI